MDQQTTNPDHEQQKPSPPKMTQQEAQRQAIEAEKAKAIYEEAMKKGPKKKNKHKEGETEKSDL